MATTPLDAQDTMGGLASRVAYGEWAMVQPDLPIFHQPRWLDIVAPGQWRALFADPSSPGASGWAWPYVTKQRYGLEWIALPPSTPYLGPYLSPGQLPPQTIAFNYGYALATVHQPEWSWTFGRSLRAMSTQVLDLRQSAALDNDMLRGLRKAKQELFIRPLESESDRLAAARLLLRVDIPWGTENLEHYFAAAAAGLADVVGVFTQATQELQGIAVLLRDQRRAYLSLLARTQGAHSSTSVALVAYGLESSRLRELQTFNFMSGFLPGVRTFHARFGARAQWYGQLRLARTPLWRGLEYLRASTNQRRI